MRRVMQGAFVLTIASFIAKVLSALYRIPLQNLVGDEGFYVYQQVYPIYGIAMTLALSGLPQFQKERILSSESKLCKVFIPWCFGQASFCGCLSFHLAVGLLG